MIKVEYKRKKKVPFTKKELQERSNNTQKIEIKRSKNLDKKVIPAIPLDKVLRMIRQIGTEEISNKTGISEDILKSWVHKVWQPRGKMSETLQEYLKSVKH